MQLTTSLVQFLDHCLSELYITALLLCDRVQAPVSQNCPLYLHKRQKGLNKLIEAVRVVSQCFEANLLYSTYMHT